jgi:hypothetical protein
VFKNCLDAQVVNQKYRGCASNNGDIDDRCVYIYEYITNHSMEIQIIETYYEVFHGMRGSEFDGEYIYINVGMGQNWVPQ